MGGKRRVIFDLRRSRERDDRGSIRRGDDHKRPWGSGPVAITRFAMMRFWYT